MIRRPPRSTRTDNSFPTRRSSDLEEANRVYSLEREEVWRESSGAPRTAFAAQIYSEPRSEEHTSELQSLMRISYAVFCLKKKNKTTKDTDNPKTHHQTKGNKVEQQ